MRLILSKVNGPTFYSVISSFLNFASHWWIINVQFILILKKMKKTKLQKIFMGFLCYPVHFFRSINFLSLNRPFNCLVKSYSDRNACKSHWLIDIVVMARRVKYKTSSVTRHSVKSDILTETNVTYSLTM